MKHKYSEKKVLKKLNIPDFSCINEDNIGQFAVMLPHMEQDVAKKALSQMPEFNDNASEIINLYRETLNKILDENSKSEEAFYHVCASIVESLQEEIKRDDIDSLERARIEDKMIEVAKMIGEKDSESKNFKFALTLVAMLGLGFLFGGIFAVGIKKSGKNDNFDDTPIDIDSIDIDSIDIDSIDIDSIDDELIDVDDNFICDDF